MKIRYSILITLSLVAKSFAGTPIPVFTNPASTQKGGFNVQTGTVTNNLTLPYIPPNQTCIGTDANSDVVASTCSTGGGGGGGGIVASSGPFSLPSLVWTTANDLAVSTNTANLNQTCIQFPLKYICETENISVAGAHRLFDISKTASWGTNPNGGIYPAQTVSNNTWISLYAVISTTTLVDFTIVGSTWMSATATFFPALNSTFGVNDWIYLGSWPYGDISTVPNQLPTGIMQGNFTILTNTLSNDSYTGVGLKLNHTAGANELIYGYGAGRSLASNQTPESILQLLIQWQSGGATNDTLQIENSAKTFSYGTSSVESGGSGGRIWVGNQGLTLHSNGPSSQPMDINLVGWVDGALGLATSGSGGSNSTTGGVTVYPATATASFPFGFSASTAVIGGATFSSVGAGGGLNMNGPVTLPQLTANQCLTLNSQGTVTTSGGACGSGGGSSGGASTLAITYNGVIITSPTSNVIVDTTTMNYTLWPGGSSSGTIAVAQNLTISTLTLTGVGAATWNATEGAASGVIGTSTNHDVMWADSSAHTFNFNPNNTSTYTVVGSSTTPTQGHVATWSNSGSLIDGGVNGAGGVSVYPATATASFPFGFIASTSVVLTGGNITISTGMYFTDNDLSFFNSNVQVNSSFTVTATTTTSYEATFSTTSTFFHVAISTNGHVIYNGIAPTISSCGTGSPSVVGNDSAGTITVGGGSVTSCTLTFAIPYGVGCTVVCATSDSITTATPDAVATPTGITFGFSASIGGGNINYICHGVGSLCH